MATYFVSHIATLSKKHDTDLISQKILGDLSAFLVQSLPDYYKT